MRHTSCNSFFYNACSATCIILGASYFAFIIPCVLFDEYFLSVDDIQAALGGIDLLALQIVDGSPLSCLPEGRGYASCVIIIEDNADCLHFGDTGCGQLQISLTNCHFACCRDCIETYAMTAICKDEVGVIAVRWAYGNRISNPFQQIRQYCVCCRFRNNVMGCVYWGVTQ